MTPKQKLNVYKKLKEIRELVDMQAEDEGLWFIDGTAAEAHVQQALRKLHRLIENLEEL